MYTKISLSFCSFAKASNADPVCCIYSIVVLWQAEWTLIRKQNGISEENFIFLYRFAIEYCRTPGSSGYKTFFLLNSAAHEISNAYRYKIIKKFNFMVSAFSIFYLSN